MKQSVGLDNHNQERRNSRASTATVGKGKGKKASLLVQNLACCCYESLESKREQAPTPRLQCGPRPAGAPLKEAGWLDVRRNGTARPVLAVSAHGTI